MPKLVHVPVRPERPSISIRLLPQTVAELELRAKKEGLRLRTYIQRLLEDLAPGRDTHTLERLMNHKRK